MKRLISVRLLLAALRRSLLCFSQELPQAEQAALNQAIGEAGSSPIELTRALENHLAKYPMSAKRPELERVLLKAAIETKDERRIILYGERVLEREQDDLQALDRVTRALLKSDAKETSERALKYSKRYVQLVEGLRKQTPDTRVSRAVWEEELNKGLARALALESRATGNAGNAGEAAAIAMKAYASYPTAEAAREVGRWLSRSGHEQEAIQYYADAFVLADPSATDSERARDRMRMGELYSKSNGSEKGLGDLILQAYDRTNAQAADRKQKMAAADPNMKASKILDFTLTGLKGDKLDLKTLAGKAVVFDFWATWCGPCRAQQPLYEQVRERFKSDPDVVLISVDTDEDRSLVEPFVKSQKWTQAIYFEDGLVRNLDISSIPTTIVVNRRGEVVSRLNGFVPDRFVDMLAERIKDALK